MNIGNELHAGLSRLSRHMHLMLTELPTEDIVFNPTYQIQYGRSYTDNVHGSSAIGFAYCLAIINRAGGLYGRILTLVVCTDLTAFGLYSRPRSRFSHTD